MSKSKLEETMALHLLALRPVEFVREFQFHDPRKWRFDFANLEHAIAVECEGGIWTNGRHTRGKGFEDDCEKYNTAMCNGWHVIRVTEKHIRSGQALCWVEMALRLSSHT